MSNVNLKTDGIEGKLVSMDLVMHLIKNPDMVGIYREITEDMLKLVDENYFKKELDSPEDKRLSGFLKDKFIDKDPVHEIRIYKMEVALFGLMRLMEAAGIMDIKDKPVITGSKIQRPEDEEEGCGECEGCKAEKITSEEDIKKRAENIFNDFKKKHNE